MVTDGRLDVVADAVLAAYGDDSRRHTFPGASTSKRWAHR